VILVFIIGLAMLSLVAVFVLTSDVFSIISGIWVRMWWVSCSEWTV